MKLRLKLLIHMFFKFLLTNVNKSQANEISHTNYLSLSSINYIQSYKNVFYHLTHQKRDTQTSFSNENRKQQNDTLSNTFSFENFLPLNSSEFTYTQNLRTRNYSKIILCKYFLII